MIDEARPFRPLRLVILTVSDTRTEEDDRSGDTLRERAERAGHEVLAQTHRPRRPVGPRGGAAGAGRR